MPCSKCEACFSLHSDLITAAHKSKWSDITGGLLKQGRPFPNTHTHTHTHITECYARYLKTGLFALLVSADLYITYPHHNTLTTHQYIQNLVYSIVYFDQPSATCDW